MGWVVLGHSTDGLGLGQVMENGPTDNSDLNWILYPVHGQNLKIISFA